jgi:hypothetical protein
MWRNLIERMIGSLKDWRRIAVAGDASHRSILVTLGVVHGNPPIFGGG